jgi:Ni/Co efflux regulator RcnB
MRLDHIDRVSRRRRGDPPVFAASSLARAMALLGALSVLSGCAAMSGAGGWMHGGETLIPAFRTPAHEIDYHSIGMPKPAMGLRWYHIDKQYVLANRTTGLIVKSMPDKDQ